MRLLSLLGLLTIVNGHLCPVDNATHLDAGTCLDSCPPGTQYYKIYNRSLCFDCHTGTFNNETNSNCIDWTICNTDLNESIYVEGTSTSDRICSCPYMLVVDGLNTCLHNCSSYLYYSELNTDNTSRFTYLCYPTNVSTTITLQSSSSELNYIMISAIGGGVILLFILAIYCYCKKK